MGTISAPKCLSVAKEIGASHPNIGMVSGTVVCWSSWSSANAHAQQYGVVTSFQPSLTNSVATIKASKAPLIYYSCYNPNGSEVFIQVFDKPNSATVMLGTTV